MSLDKKLAARAILAEIGATLNTEDPAIAADAILKISNSNSVQALRLATIYRGYDPRDFAVLAYGGAGPLFASQIARLADIPTVIIPPLPGVVSAMGLLMMDVLYELTTAILKPAHELSDGAVNDVIAELEAQVVKALIDEGISPDDIRTTAEVDVRYFGMSHSITVPIEMGPDLVERICATYSEVHDREYGYTVPDDIAPIELANVRVAGTAAAGRTKIKARPPTGKFTDPDEAIHETRPVYFDGEFRETPVYDRSMLGIGMRISGPAVIEQADTTTLIDPGMSATVDEIGALIVDVGLELNYESVGANGSTEQAAGKVVV